MRLPICVSAIAAMLVVAVACSESSTPSTTGGADGDGGTNGSSGSTGTSGGSSGSSGSETVDASKEAGTTLTPTETTSTNVTIDAVSRTLERAQFGVTAANDTLYLEAYEGGVQACPEEETPKRTLIVNGVPKGEPGQTFTEKDEVSVSVIDFTGDQIPGTPPSTKATAVKVTIVALDGETSAEIEIDATFPEGTAKGRIYATYCAAMSE